MEQYSQATGSRPNAEALYNRERSSCSVSRSPRAFAPSASAALLSAREHRPSLRLSLAKKRATTFLKDANFRLKYPSVSKALVEVISPSLSPASPSVGHRLHQPFCSGSTAEPIALETVPLDVLGAPPQSSLPSALIPVSSPAVEPPYRTAASFSVPASAPSVAPTSLPSQLATTLCTALDASPICLSDGPRDARVLQPAVGASADHAVPAACSSSGHGEALVPGAVDGGVAVINTLKEAVGLGADASCCSTLPSHSALRRAGILPISGTPAAEEGPPTGADESASPTQQLTLTRGNTYFTHSLAYSSSALPLSPAHCQIFPVAIATSVTVNPRGPTGQSHPGGPNRENAAFTSTPSPTSASGMWPPIICAGLPLAMPAETRVRNAAVTPSVVASAGDATAAGVPPLPEPHPEKGRGQAAARGCQAGAEPVREHQSLESLPAWNDLHSSACLPTCRLPPWPFLPQASSSSLLPLLCRSPETLLLSPHSSPPSQRSRSIGQAQSQRSRSSYPYTFSSFPTSGNGVCANAATGGDSDLPLRLHVSTPDLRQQASNVDSTRQPDSIFFPNNARRHHAVRQFVSSADVRASPPSSDPDRSAAERSNADMFRQGRNVFQGAEKLRPIFHGQQDLQQLRQQLPQKPFLLHPERPKDGRTESQQPQENGRAGAAEDRHCAEHQGDVMTQAAASHYIPAGVQYRSRLLVSSHIGEMDEQQEAGACRVDLAGKNKAERTETDGGNRVENPKSNQLVNGTVPAGGHQGHIRDSGCVHPNVVSPKTPPAAEAASASTSAQAPEPPQHFVNRFEELRRRYEGAMRTAKTVELQYRLFRSLDRPQPVLQAALRSSPFLPSTPSPGNYFSQQSMMLPPARAASFPLLRQNGGRNIDARVPPSQQLHAYKIACPATQTVVNGAVPSAAGYRFLGKVETAAAGHYAQTSEYRRQPHLSSSCPPTGPKLYRGSFRQQQAAEDAAAVVRAGDSICNTRDWKGFGPVIKDGIVNPAIVMEKQLMDEALCQMQYESVALQQQSRELGMHLTDQQQQAQNKMWRRLGVREALCDINQEQQAFLKEQLRALDQTRGDLRTMQDEAARMERRARDMFYRKLYTSPTGSEDEEVRWHKEQMKTLEHLRRQLPSTAALEATISHFISSCSSTSGLLHRLEECGLATVAEDLSPEACGQAVNRLLKRMGFEEQSAAVPVRRADGLPAQYQSRFPGLYPHPEFNESLPRSQQALREHIRNLEAEGEPTSFSTAVQQQKQQQYRQADTFLSVGGTSVPEAASKPELLQLQLVHQQQQQKQQLDQDWEEFFRSRREAKAVEEAQRAVEEARREAVKAADEAKQAVELLAKRQRALEMEAAAAERKAVAEREAAIAAQHRAEAERQAAKEAAAAAEDLLRQQRLRREVQKAAEEGQRRRDAEGARLRGRRMSPSRAASVVGGPEDRREREGMVRRSSSKRTDIRGLGSRQFSKRNTLTVEAAEDLAEEMRRKESIVTGLPRALQSKSASVATAQAKRAGRRFTAIDIDGQAEASRGTRAAVDGRLSSGSTTEHRRRTEEEGKRGRGMERRSSQYLDMRRTLTMHKTPLSRSLSASVARDAERLLLDANSENQTFDDQQEIRGIQPPDRLLLSAGSKRFAVYAHMQRREKAELIGNSPFATRLPFHKCEAFVLLDPPDASRLQRRSLYERYKDVKNLLASDQLGLKENAQDVYDFAVSCCHRSVRTDPRGQEYANVLIEAIPYYPYQIDIQRAGIIALLNIFEHCKYQEQLAIPLFDCLTTLLAIEDGELRGDVVAVMAAVIRPQVSLNSEVVDLLLELLQTSPDASVCCYCLHVLLVGRSPHHKEQQYAAFVRVLEKWKFDPTVPTRACLAVDAFARRAVQEELALHERRKGPRPGAPEKQQRQKPPESPVAGESGGDNFSYGLDLYRRGSSFPLEAQVQENIQPPAWMTPTRVDVEKIVLVMERHPQHRRLQGAASQALASLAATSLSHSESIAERGFSQINAAALNHKESQTVAISLCSLVALLAALPSCQNALHADLTETVHQLLVRHRSVPEGVAAASAALAKLDALYPVTDEILDTVTLAILLNNLRNAADQPDIVVSIAELLQRIALRYEDLAVARKRLEELGAVEALLKATTACSFSHELCEISCKAISHLVYHQDEDSEVYVQLVKYRATTTFLYVLLKNHQHASLCREILCCIANCCAHPDCAKTITERGMNVICKAISANVKDMEVVAQGCRCLHCIAMQPELKDAVSHRASSIISFAAEEFSSRLDTRALVTEFLTDIFHGRGVRAQMVEPLWSNAAAAARSSAATAAPLPFLDNAAGSQMPGAGRHERNDAEYSRPLRH